MTPLTCENLVAELTRVNAPVLLLDTCTILDVVRAPVREQLGTHDIDAVHTLVCRANGTPPEVSLVITEQVLKEFSDHISKVECETRDGIEKATDNFAKILERMHELFPNLNFEKRNELTRWFSE